jgi:hypothetical protein
MTVQLAPDAIRSTALGAFEALCVAVTLPILLRLRRERRIH